MKDRLIRLLLAVTPSFIKVLLLKKKGSIGSRLQIGSGSMIKCQSLKIGDLVQIGKNVLIIGDHVELGNRVRIEDNCFIKAKKGIVIGDDTYIEKNNYIGGLQSVDSYLEIGERVGVFPDCFINTTKRVIIGDDVGIGGRSLIFTHGTWQNILEGYPYSFGDVVLEKNVWLPWKVFILPRVTIGQNSTIGSSSVVSSNIPPDCFAAGIPCKVIKESNKNSASSSVQFKYEKLKEIFLELIEHFKVFHGIHFAFRNDDTSRELLLDADALKILFTEDTNRAEQFDGYVFCNFSSSTLKENQADIKSYRAHYPTNKTIQHIFTFLAQYGIRFKYI